MEKQETTRYCALILQSEAKQGVNRDSFLREALKDYCTQHEVEIAIKYTPFHVLSSPQLNSIVEDIIATHHGQIPTFPFAIYRPVLCPLSKDWSSLTAWNAPRNFSIFLTMVQQLAYVNGYPDLHNPEGKLDDYAVAVLTPMLGIAMGVCSLSNRYFKVIHNVAQLITEDLKEQTSHSSASRIFSIEAIQQIAQKIEEKMADESKMQHISPLLKALSSAAYGYHSEEFVRHTEALAHLLKENRNLFLNVRQP